MNKKLTKLLSVFLMAGLITTGAATSLTGCKNKGNEPEGPTQQQPGDEEQKPGGEQGGQQGGEQGGEQGGSQQPASPVVSSVQLASSTEGIAINKGKIATDTRVSSITLVATVSGDNLTETGVTWSITGDGATVADGVVTITGVGVATVTATSKQDTTKSASVEIIIQQYVAIPADETDRAVVPTYAGPAAGPEAGEKTFTKTFNASTAGANSEYTDGFYNISGGSGIVSRSNGNYTHAAQNANITFNAAAAGTLKIYAENGSTGKTSSFTVTKKGASSAMFTKDMEVDKKAIKEISVDITEAGEYTIAKTANTIYIYKLVFEYTAESAPIVAVEVTGALKDYVITQKVDCTGVTAVSKDANGVTYDVAATNLEFDTSNYNPNMSGEYEIGVKYTLSDNLTSETKVFNTTYKVKVYAVSSIQLYTIKRNGSGELSLQQACLPGAEFSKNYLTVVGTCQLGADEIEYTLKPTWYEVSTPDLTSEGEKEVTVTVNNSYTFAGKSVTAKYSVIVAAKKPVTNNQVEVTVGETGDFRNVTQAVQYIEACEYDDAVEKIIKVAPGTYDEKVRITANNVTLIGTGTDADKTVITHSFVEDTVDLGGGGRFGLDCATVQVDGKNFKAYNLSIRNDFDYINEASKYGSPQGLALTINGDQAVIYKCHLYGNQDTLYLKSGRSYFKESQIDGNVDFIFGNNNGLAYFDNCTIVAINRAATPKSKDDNGYVTAHKATSSDKPNYGYIFDNCTLTDDGNVKAGSMGLGRPWGAASTVAYINCTMGEAYSTQPSDASTKMQRWHNWDSNTKAENADYCEYGTTGAGAITEAVKGGKILTDTQAANYTKANIFAATNGKVTWTSAWDCDHALDNLKATVDPSSVVTITVKNTAGDVVTTIRVNKDTTLTAAQLSSVINAELSATNRDITGLFSSYTNETTNTAYESATWTESGEVVVIVRVKQYVLDMNSSDMDGNKTAVQQFPDTVESWEGTYWYNAGATPRCVKVKGGTVIKFKVAGRVSIVWFNGQGTDADAKITYKDGCATITITNANDRYINSITINCLDVPEDTPVAANKYTVSFNLNGGDSAAINNQTVDEGDKATAPAAPTKTGNDFLGWYTAATGGTKYTFNEEVNANVELFAHWQVSKTLADLVVIDNNSTTKQYAYDQNSDTTTYSTEYFNLSSCAKNNDWLRLNNGTITFKVAAGALITIGGSPHDGSNKWSISVDGGTAITESGDDSTAFKRDASNVLTYTATAGGTIALTGNGVYCKTITVSFPGVPSSVTFGIGDDVLNITDYSSLVDGTAITKEGVTIPSSGFVKKNNGSVDYFEVANGTVISFGVGDLTDATCNIVVYEFGGSVQSSGYTAAIADGVCTITATDNLYLGRISIAGNT